jgi:hypothetical protein
MKHFISAIAVAFLAFCFAPNSHAQQGKPGMGMKMTGKELVPPHCLAATDNGTTQAHRAVERAAVGSDQSLKANVMAKQARRALGWPTGLLVISRGMSSEPLSSRMSRNP